MEVWPQRISRVARLARICRVFWVVKVVRVFKVFKVVRFVKVFWVVRVVKVFWLPDFVFFPLSFGPPRLAFGTCGMRSFYHCTMENIIKLSCVVSIAKALSPEIKA